MSVRCFASSCESRTPPLNLLLNGQHQLHRGEDGPHPGQHQHQEGADQAQHGELLHLPGQEHHVSGLLHHHQWEDQDRPGQRLLQQRHHHHLFSESLLPPQAQEQDALDERGPRLGVGALAPNARRKRHHHRELMDTAAASTPVLVQLREKNWIKSTLGVLTLFGHDGFTEETVPA